MDKIYIENLEIFCNHGVFKEENVLGQKFLVSAVLYTNTRQAAKSEDLTKSIHYGEICQRITKFMKEHTYKLIETAAEKVAEYLLLDTPNLEKVELTIKKPWAPIGLSLETVAVSIERGWHQAYVAIGSNLGDKKKYLDESVKALEETTGCNVIACADYIETEPYGYTEQDTFLNGCLEVRTLLTPEELLDRLHEIEQDANRTREIHWGPRTLDMDIIFYDDEIISQPDLIVPHVDMANRDFVLKPLAQIAPYKRHPVLKKTVLEMLKEHQWWHERWHGCTRW